MPISRSRGVSVIAALALILGTLGLLAPAAVAQESQGSVDADGQKWQTHDMIVPEAGVVTVSLAWEDPSANLNLFVRAAGATDPGPLVAHSKTAAAPEQASFNATEGQLYRIYVEAETGASDYTLVTDRTAGDQIRYAGTVELGVQTYRAHAFTLSEPRLVVGVLDRLGEEGDLGLYLRTAAGTVLGVSRTDSDPERLTRELPAGDYEWLVRAESAAAAYDLDTSASVTGPLGAGDSREFVSQVGFQATGGAVQMYQSHEVTLAEDGDLQVGLSWMGGANLDLFISPVHDGVVGPILASSATGLPLEKLTVAGKAGETYRLTVKATSGAAGYVLTAGLDATGLRSIVGTSHVTSQNWRTYAIEVAEPGLLTGELSWAGQADLSLYLRNPSGDLVKISKTSANPERISYEVKAAGTYEVVVSALSGGSDWNLSVDQQTGISREYSGHVGFQASGGGRQGFVAFDYLAPVDGTVTAVLNWATAADLDLYVREIVDPAQPDAGPLVISSITPLQPEQFSFEANAGTSYRLLVGARTGAAHFDLGVTVQDDPFQRTFLGTSVASGQRYRTYPFSVATAGELTATLDWQGSAAMALFLRDPSGALLAQAITPEQPQTIDVDLPGAGVYQLVVAASTGYAPFSLDAAFVPSESAPVCAPLSTLGCDELVLDGDVAFTFDGTDGGLVDVNGEPVGFTVVDPPSSRLPADGDPTFPEVPGYEPDLLEISEDGLTISATRGIQYSKPPTTGSNSLLNGLGIGLEPHDGTTTITTTVVAPTFDATANSEKGGLWYFLDEDNLVNVSVQNQVGANVRVQFQREVDGVSVAAVDEFNGLPFPGGTDVHLTLVLDAEDASATASYRVADGPEVTLGTFDNLPAGFFEGVQLPADHGSAVFAGVYATARNELTTPIAVTFAEFSVQTQDAPEIPNTAPDLLLTGDRVLFEGQDATIPVQAHDEDGDELSVSVEGLPTGLSFDGTSISGTVAVGTSNQGTFDVAVVVDDGKDQTHGTFTIQVIPAVSLDVSFQSAAGQTPSGYLPDSGQSYADRGNGWEYGWVSIEDGEPLNMSGNGRVRGRPGIDPLLDSFVHMQYGDIANVYGGNANCTANQCAEGAWEVALPDGLYEVTVVVGDQPSSGTYDSLHALNLEGGVVIREFQASAQQEYLQATAFAGVEGGRLTVTATGGANTKIVYIQIRSVGNLPFATSTIPANRADDASLDTAVSASVSVPGLGLAVDPDKDTSLTEDTIRLFQVTGAGDIEVEATRGSTGANDTISISPVAPLLPNTAYRFVIDGVLDEAGQAFARFESTFTTGDGDVGGTEEFSPVEGVTFEKVLLPTASGAANGKYFASLTVHQGYLWATTIGQGTYRYEILPDGTLGPAQNLNVLQGRAAIGMVWDSHNPNLVWVTHATANIFNESSRWGTKVSVIDFTDVAAPIVTDVFINLPRAQRDHLANSLTYGPSGDGGAPWMYFPQGSNQAAGNPDGSWGNRGETQLTAAILRFDPEDSLATALSDGPIDVRTADLGGEYDPYEPGAPLEIYATGVRNAYDLVWHSNGHLYVPTNGTAGGANTPGVTDNGDGTFTMVSGQGPSQSGYGNGTDVTTECTQRRIDGEIYSGGTVPSLNNLPTQKDYMFDVVEGGYYGHPNPTRCEWALSDASANGYGSNVTADPNFRGFAYDFDFNKSPNGVIEYASETFGGALAGRLMVVRFSANDDILTLQVGEDGTVLGSQPGTTVEGFTGFVDPLDLIEDTEINPGNIYINQYNRDGEPQQLYLLRVPAEHAVNSVSINKTSAILAATLNNHRPVDSVEVEITNNGADTVTLTGALTGTHAGQFTVTSPLTVPAGATASATIEFDPNGPRGVRTATATWSSDEGSVSVDLRALAFPGEEGSLEPYLQEVVNTFDFGIDVGWNHLADGVSPLPKGDEVLVPLFQSAGPGPVLMTPVAAFAPQENLPFGWYPATSGPASLNQVGMLATGQLQRLHPALASGGTSFDPGAQAFGLYYDSQHFNRVGYTEDHRNTGGVAHRARIYPLTGDRFLVAFEDASNGDYQDYVFVLSNAKAAGSFAPMPHDGEPVRISFRTQGAALPEGYLRDFGQGYGERDGSDQGDAYVYGWRDATTLAPKNVTTNSRVRNLGPTPQQMGLMHMDLPAGAATGVPGEVLWEIAVEDGTYEVEISVGDPANGSDPESHTINVEGVTAVDAFPKAGAANGSADRHLVATVIVTVDDGALTIDQTGGINTKINYLEITPTDPPIIPIGDPIKVNFQAETSTAPDGYLADFGQAFGARTGADQGEGLSYGWVAESNGAPLDLSGNGRQRSQNIDPRLSSLMHMALPPGSVGNTTPGAWELEVDPGTYRVTVAVGDSQAGTAAESHVITVEGVAAIEGFTSTGANGAPTRHAHATVVVEVLDGRLTIDQIGGTNTKINFVDVEPLGGVPDLVAAITFAPAASATPEGWSTDSGLAFDAGRGYGWVGANGSGVNKTADTRDRGTADPLTSSLIIVDNAVVPSVTNGSWQYVLPNGDYVVEASVGDPSFSDSTHGISAEGVPLITGYVPPSNGAFGVGSAEVSVTDGALTIASTGTNTKLQWVRVYSGPSLDLVPPRVTIGLAGQGGPQTYGGAVTVEVTAVDQALASVTYSLNGGAPLDYAGPFQVTAVGEHEVEVTATDAAGHSTTTQRAFEIVPLGNGALTLTNPEAAPFHDHLVMSRIQSPNSNPQTKTTSTLVLGNNGSGPIQIHSLDIAEPDAFALVNPPALPFQLAQGSTLTLTVQFVGTGTGANTNFTSSLTIGHDAANGPVAPIRLGGIWQNQSESGQEPDLMEIVEAFGFGTTIVGPGQNLNNQGRLEAIGDEVLSATWSRANTNQPVTVRQLAAYHTCCNNTASFGWHPVNNKNAWTQVLTHHGAWAQSLLPRISGTSGNPAFVSFTPGPATWSWRVDPESSDWTLNNTGPDQCGPGNAGCQLGHHLRLWPVKTPSGEIVPDTYLLVMDYSGINYDFQDNVYLVTNIKPANPVVLGEVPQMARQAPGDASPEEPAAPVTRADDLAIREEDEVVAEVEPDEESVGDGATEQEAPEQEPEASGDEASSTP